MSTSPHIAAYRAAVRPPWGKAAALAARTDAPATVSGAVISRESLCISAGVVPYIQIRISIQPFRENKGHIYILLCLRKNMHGPAVRAYQRCGEKSSKPLFISSSQCRPGRYASWPPDGGLSGNCRLREDIKAREIHEANIDAPVSPFQPYEISSCMLPEADLLAAQLHPSQFLPPSTGIVPTEIHTMISAIF